MPALKLASAQATIIDSAQELVRLAKGSLSMSDVIMNVVRSDPDLAKRSMQESISGRTMVEETK